MDPTKIHKDISVDIKFAIPPSNKKCMLTIHLKKNQLLLDVVRRIMNDNKIPCYLEISLLSVIEHLIQESLRNDIERDSKVKSESEAIEIRKNLVSKYKKHTVRYNDAPTENGFPKAYHTLVHSPVPSIFDTLLQLEQEYKKAIKDTISTHEIELERIKDRHHKEVEGIVDAANLFEKHQEDVEYNQATLASELGEIKRKQKDEYRDLVVKLYEAHQRWLTENQSTSDPNWIFRLDGKEIVSEVISSLKKSQKALSKQVLRLDQGYGTRSRHSSISSLTEVMLSPVAPSPPSPMFSPVSSSFCGNGEDNYFNDDILKMVNDIQEMGFNYDQAKVALEMANGNKEQAVNLLCEKLEKIDAQIANNAVLLPRRATMLFASSPLKEPSNSRQKPKSLRKPKLTILTNKQEKRNTWSPISFFNQKQPTPSTPVKRFSGWLSRKVMDDVNGHVPHLHLADNPQMMETFTISLGSQVKSTHNIKLLASDMDDLLKSSNDAARDMAYRTQTAANLYSQNLTAIILLLTPRDWPSYKLGKSANKAFFARCKESTEFHFKDVESQFEAIEKDFGKSEVQEGDFFITKHSNLPLVHVVFHLVIEFESIITSELTHKSRVIDGLRNVLRTIDRFDITSISLPFLLLPSDIDPFSDVTLEESILYKRGELVLKCTKGSMMQNSRISNQVSNEKEQEARTVSFLLSKNANEKQFHNFRNLLTGIFKPS